MRPESIRALSELPDMHPSDEVALVAICSALWMEVISLEVGRRITSHVQRGSNGFVSPESCLERRLYPVQKKS